MSSALGWLRACALASAILSSPVNAQSNGQKQLPPVTVEAPQQKRDATSRPSRVAVRSPRIARARRTPEAPVQSAGDQIGASRVALGVLSAQQALKEINNTPGGVAIVPAEAYRNSTVSNTIKDILDYVPGVFAQPKWGDDTRLSIRGSGLSRNFHLRGVQLYMDGIPINTADGYGDFQEIDPTAYKYVAVQKGGNALQYGANSWVVPSISSSRLVAIRVQTECPSILVPSASSDCKPMPAVRTAHGMALSLPRPRHPTAFGIIASDRATASTAISVIRYRRTSKRGSISTPTRYASAFRAAWTEPQR